jgi:uncharacterized protein YqgQ
MLEQAYDRKCITAQSLFAAYRRLGLPFGVPPPHPAPRSLYQTLSRVRIVESERNRLDDLMAAIVREGDLVVVKKPENLIKLMQTELGPLMSRTLFERRSKHRETLYHYDAWTIKEHLIRKGVYDDAVRMPEGALVYTLYKERDDPL